jgi:hypothetical protein
MIAKINNTIMTTIHVLLNIKKIKHLKFTGARSLFKRLPYIEFTLFQYGCCNGIGHIGA